MVRRVGCLLALTLLSACSVAPSPGSPQPQPSAPASGPSRFRTTEPLPSGPSGMPATLSAERLAAIAAELRGRGVTAQPVVISAEDVRFSDGSLGCPRPGVQYTQAVVDGMRVVVEAGGRRYDYRFGTTDTPKLCERTLPVHS